MPPFWRTLLGGGSGSSNNNSNSNPSFSSTPAPAPAANPQHASTSALSSSSTSSLASTSSQQQRQRQHPSSSSTTTSTSTPNSSRLLSRNKVNSSSSLSSHPTSTSTSAPIGIPKTKSKSGGSSNNHHTNSSSSLASTSAARSNSLPGTSLASKKSIVSSSSSSIATSSSDLTTDDLDQDEEDADLDPDQDQDGEEGPIPDTPYSTGHSPSHARHKFPQDKDRLDRHHHAHHAHHHHGHGHDDNNNNASSSSEKVHKSLVNQNDENGNSNEASEGTTSSANLEEGAKSSPNDRPSSNDESPPPDIPTTHTILANPVSQSSSSGLSAAIASVLPLNSLNTSTNASPPSPTVPPPMTALSPVDSKGAPITANAGDPSQPRTFDIDDMISRLLETGYSGKLTKSVSLKNSEITALCLAAREVFLSQPTLLELSPPVKIVGDVHGQYSDLIRLFEMCGFPPKGNYLFLGDYVDRGKQSLETILLLLCYKVKYPENFFLLRGNHECANVTRVYGFYDECKRRCNIKTWKTFVDVFNCLPIAAIVAGKIFCVHGGLSPSLSNMDDIRRISRPTDVPDYGLLNDLLWSDPSDTALDWEDNERGVSYCFGKAVIQDFLARYDFDLICRAHMVVEDGYEFWNDRTLVTVFSAPNYCGEFDNFGASLSVDVDLLCTFQLLKPLDGTAMRKELARVKRNRTT